ncbi:MAG: hypothetical protein IKU25_01755 [Clostridia bacterium]|nr:hypothetical protein [Clostridia bacterium]
MFAKLLKHDCKAIFKYWWIVSVISAGVSLVAGIALSIMNVGYTAHNYIQTAAIIIFFFCFFAIILLPLVTQLLTFIRFRKNFFTDEGYLTFTLPVNKSALLGSKTLASLIFSAASGIVFFLDICIVSGVEDLDNIGNLFYEISHMFKNIFNPFEWNVFVTFILTILIGIACAVFFNLFIFLCITISNMLVKKHRLLFGLALYYGSSIVFVLILQFLSSNGIFESLMLAPVFSEWYPVLILFGVFGIIAAFCAGAYLLEVRLLDKRLNLE